MRTREKAAAVTCVAVLAQLFLASSALATFHLMAVREIYPGSTANPGAEYVELQMYSQGQNLVGGHVLHTYTATGGVTNVTLPTDVANSANQSTILIAGAEAQAVFPTAIPDAALPPGDLLDPAGGAVCWESIDCASWGSFSGSPAATTGTPAPAIPDGKALRRKIAPGCATLLEATDDTDNSAADFEAVFPSPRPNSVAPTEHSCGPGGPGPGSTALQTTFRRKPTKRTRDRTPTFRFASNQSGATFECKLDGGRFSPCGSPFTTRKLSFGRHTFRVRATAHFGELIDTSPAAYSFRVVKRRR